jgi:alpha-aminoadipate carrier protein LysW
MSSDTKTSNCPVCDTEVSIDDGTLVNEILPCPDCGAELEVTSLDPVKLSEAPEVEEDWGE